MNPLPAARPKALGELSGRTLLEITLTRLRTFGVTEAIINVHHFADMVIAYLKPQNNFGIRIEISREAVLHATGGGLKKAAWFFLEDSSRLDEPFLLHNVDVISNIDLRRMLQFHTENQALATLAVQTRETSRPLLFDNNNQLRGRRLEANLPLATSHSPLPQVPEQSPKTHEPLPQSPQPSPLQSLAFSAIHIISPRLLPMLTEEGVFSIIPSYVRLSAQGQKIQAFRPDQFYWRDLGLPSDLAQAALDFHRGVPR